MSSRRSAILSVLGATVLASAVGARSPAAESLYEAYRPYILRHERTADRIIPGVAVRAASPVFGRTSTAEWADLIDSTWGPGLSATDELQVFDTFWNRLDEGYGAFMNLDVDLDAIRARYRPEIAAGVNRGRFAAILNQLSLAMLDGHTFIVDRTFGKPSNGAFTSSDSETVDPFWWITGATGSGYLIDGHIYLAHTGVQPDEEVWLTRDDVARGVDTVVEAALAWIRSAPRRPGGRLSP